VKKDQERTKGNRQQEHVNIKYTGWAKNHTKNFVRKNLGKTLAKTVKFGTTLPATFLNISAENYTNTKLKLLALSFTHTDVRNDEFKAL